MLYLAKGVAATTSIEGNTLSEEDVLKRIKGQLPLPDSKEYLGQEVDNIVNACNIIAQRQFADTADVLTVEKIKEYNRMVLAKLSLQDNVIPGEIQ